jgi:hypothetical protein
LATDYAASAMPEAAPPPLIDADVLAVIAEHGGVMRWPVLRKHMAARGRTADDLRTVLDGLSNRGAIVVANRKRGRVIRLARPAKPARGTRRASVSAAFARTYGAQRGTAAIAPARPFVVHRSTQARET